MAYKKQRHTVRGRKTENIKQKKRKKVHSLTGEKKKKRELSKCGQRGDKKLDRSPKGDKSPNWKAPTGKTRIGLNGERGLRIDEV